MNYLNKISLIIIAICSFSFNLSAHYIWIEMEEHAKINNEQKIKIFYGEFNEGLREIEGGRLEELEGIESWVVMPNGAKQDLEVIKTATHFEVKFTPTTTGQYTIIAVNKVREVVDWSKYGIGIIKPTYYASKQIIIGTESKEPISTGGHPELFIVSLENNTAAKPIFKLLYKNKPLANTKLFVHAANKWSKEQKTDENGVFTFNPLWKGVYIIECIYTEKKEGMHLGDTYEAIRHRVTYSCMQQPD